jgi:uncharacterized protein
MAQPVVHFEVIGRDPNKLRDYYGQLFGWSFADPMGPNDYATIQDLEGIGEAALGQAESLGGRRMMGPDEVPGVGIVIGLLQDPEGHVIGVMSPTASANGAS